jgi:hypothetical protein
VASVLCDSRFEFVLRTPLIENYDVEMLKRSYGGNPCANTAKTARAHAAQRLPCMRMAAAAAAGRAKRRTKGPAHMQRRSGVARVRLSHVGWCVVGTAARIF